MSATAADLRKAFAEKYEKANEAKEVKTGDIHENDLKTIRTCDAWLENLLQYYDGDIEKALTRLWETCLWRKHYGVNEIVSDKLKLKREYFESGQIFVHNRDIEGNPLLIFCLKKHTKSQDIDELLRILVYWIELRHHHDDMQKLTMIFDMSGTGFSNVNYDFIRQITQLIDQHYPTLLTRIIVHELPFLLNAAFKIVKTFLPAQAVDSLTLTNNKNLKQYVDSENALKIWGGNDDYQFKIDDAVRN